MAIKIKYYKFPEILNRCPFLTNLSMKRMNRGSASVGEYLFKVLNKENFEQLFAPHLIEI